MLPVMWDAFRRHQLPIPMLARLLAAAPAQIFGLSGKGVIAPGMDADLVVIDPEREVEIRDEHQAGGSGYSLYHGRRVRGWPTMSFLRGQVLLDGETLRQPEGCGRYIARRASQPTLTVEPGRAPSQHSPRTTSR